MSKNNNKKQRRWRPFSKLFKKQSEEPEIVWSEPEQKEVQEQEEGFVIEESDDNVTEIQESTTDIFVPESALKDYAVLGLDEDVSDAKLKRRYRILVKENHPDNGGDPKEFMKIQKAYKKEFDGS